MWSGTNPFPWFNFEGPLYYSRTRNYTSDGGLSIEAIKLLGKTDTQALARALMGHFGIEGLREILMRSSTGVAERLPFEFLAGELLVWLQVIDAMPSCDLNIATLWSTAFPVFFSRKGKPVYFMQHYEEVFYPLQPAYMMHRLGARLSYMLPMYKVANSSWLQRVIRERFGQEIPFSNNGIDLADFHPQPKKSKDDGIIRVFTYSRPEEWKGFGDAVAAMSLIVNRYGRKVEWHVFGYKHPGLPSDNRYARYTYHPKLSFQELGRLYATSDIALCPSWYESFPLPPLEAMASATAVVTTDYGTEDYAFNGENALVVGTRQVRQMYEAVAALVEDAPLRQRLAMAGRETAQRFTWDTAVRRREQILLDIYRGNIHYDVLESAKLGLRDSVGIQFEHAPADLESGGNGMFWHDGHLYVLYNGTRRHVTSGELIPLLIERDVRYVEADDLTAARLPLGFPLVSQADIPGDL
jgi:glycosyltransferase involved in cell wall biosynthesis